MPEHEVDLHASILALPDRTLASHLVGAFRNARQRIYASVFIVDVRFGQDPDRAVRSLLHELALARWRGVDVRVLLGRSARTADIQIANDSTASFLTSFGVPCRSHPAPGGSHSKLAVVDEAQVVVGSHNWTHRALLLSREDSVMIQSSSTASQLAEDFLREWRAAEATYV